MLRFFSLSLLPKSLLLSSEFCRYVLFFNPPIDAISRRINHGNRLLFCYQIHAHLQSFSRIKRFYSKFFPLGIIYSKKLQVSCRLIWFCIALIFFSALYNLCTTLRFIDYTNNLLSNALKHVCIFNLWSATSK